MILPMKKYSMLIHHRDFHKFLKSLQSLGVVDVVDRGIEPDEDTNCEIQRVQQFDHVIKYLKSREQKDTPAETNLMPGKILKIVLQSQAELDDLRQKIALLEKHHKVLVPWGSFSPDTIKKLEDHGLKLRFFSVSHHRFNQEWMEQYNLEVIDEMDGETYFVILQTDEEEITIDADEVRAPDRPAGEVKEEIDELKAKIESTENFFREHARAYLPKLIRARTETENRISFDNVKQNAENSVEDSLKIVEGWVPKKNVEQTNEFLDNEGIFYIVENPTKGEKVPVLLKNDRFSKLFEPISKLYALPDYAELDLTPFFAPFFMLFFGFCLGDAGYGLLFLIGTIILKPRFSKEYHPIISLIQWLGGATVLFGILTGTFFGINIIDLIDQGKLQGLSNLRAYMLDPDRMFNAALILGGVQIVYGMGIKTANLIRQYGLRSALDTIGWILLIVGGIILYAFSNEDNQDLITILFYILLGISGILILFLNTPGKNIFYNFGVGLWNVYNSASGLLGDLLSYIRLFALGVSSAILGYVFNVLALEMSGSTPVVSQIIFLLIILVGHGLNIFMASIGAFVHPMRLTFLEFYKNAGFSGGGKAYSPFTKK